MHLQLMQVIQFKWFKWFNKKFKKFAKVMLLQLMHHLSTSNKWHPQQLVHSAHSVFPMHAQKSKLVSCSYINSKWSSNGTSTFMQRISWLYCWLFECNMYCIIGLGWLKKEERREWILLKFQLFQAACSMQYGFTWHKFVTSHTLMLYFIHMTSP